MATSLTLWFVAHFAYLTIDGLTQNNHTADITVILGSKVNEDGTLSPRLKARMQCGLDLYRNKQVKQILVSGGLGKEGHYEGSKKKEFLISNGVPDSVVIEDNQGNIRSPQSTIRYNLKIACTSTTLLWYRSIFILPVPKNCSGKSTFIT